VAALETRLLLLGAVSLFAPVNGYQLRRELMSWEVDRWANTAPGSIYNGLTTLAKRGDLIRHDLRDEGRDVAVYEVSEQGREEFARLFEMAMTTVSLTTPIAFHTAMALLPLVTRDNARRLIMTRLEKLDELRRLYAEAPTRSAPPHVEALTTLWSRLGAVEHEWLTRLVFRIGDGAFDFAGEEAHWTPDADDPGWQMADDRRRYLGLLARADAPTRT
jgi:DNA-binding PadR family transcriptional regulator